MILLLVVCLLVFFFFKQKTGYGFSACRVGSERWIRDRKVPYLGEGGGTSERGFWKGAKFCGCVAKGGGNFWTRYIGCENFHNWYFFSQCS